MSGWKASCTLALCAVSLFGLAAREGDGWGIFRPDGSVFMIKLPGRPQVEAHDENDPQVGKISTSTYHVMSNNVVFMVEDMNFQKGSPVLRGPVDTMLLNVEKTFAQSSGATVVSTQSGKMQGYPVRVMMLKRDDVYFRGFTVTAGTHNLIFLAAASQDAINSPDVTKFLESFRVVNL